MIASWVGQLTWSRVGAALSGALIVFGIADATIAPHASADVGGRTSALTAGAPRTVEAGGELATCDMAAGRVAAQFVTAINTTDPAQRAGDLSQR